MHYLFSSSCCNITTHSNATSFGCLGITRKQGRAWEIFGWPRRYQGTAWRSRKTDGGTSTGTSSGHFTRGMTFSCYLIRTLADTVKRSSSCISLKSITYHEQTTNQKLLWNIHQPVLWHGLYDLSHLRWPLNLTERFLYHRHYED